MEIGVICPTPIHIKLRLSLYTFLCDVARNRTADVTPSPAAALPLIAPTRVSQVRCAWASPSPARAGWALEGKVEGHHGRPTPVPTSPPERLKRPAEGTAQEFAGGHGADPG